MFASKGKRTGSHTNLRAITLLLICLLSVVDIGPEASVSSVDLEYEPIIKAVDVNVTKQYVDYFSSLGSRYTSYPGNQAAASFIRQKFADLGLENVEYENFTFTVSVEYEAEMVILNEEEKIIELHPLEPNGVNPSPISNEEGHLIYVETGELCDFNGKNITGAIVLMDFISEDNWINAAKLGAKAVIFIEPQEIFSNIEAQKKSVEIPLNFPRLWVSRQNGLYLSELAQQDTIVRVTSKVIYEEKTASNVVGVIRGSDIGYKAKSDGTIDLTGSIAITAHYDSTSVVPSIAPGAEDALGISALLDLAQYFSEHQPRRTVLFIAFSGYWQGLAGSRDYVDRHLEGKLNQTLTYFNLDFSTDTDSLGLMYVGDYYDYNFVYAWSTSPIDRAIGVYRRITMYYLPEIERQLGRIFSVDNGIMQTGYHDICPIQYFLDTEPLMLAGALGISFRTSRGRRPYLGTPIDTPDKINYANLKPQLETVFCLLVSFANDLDDWALYYPTSRGGTNGGFSTLGGQVTEYSYQTGWYEPVPNAIVRIVATSKTEVVETVGEPESRIYEQQLIVKTDENGYFKVDGLINIFTTQFGFTGKYIYIVNAYVIDNATGSVLYAPNRGVYGAQFGESFFVKGQATTRATFAVFKCATLITYDAIHPFTQESKDNTAEILKSVGKSEPIEYGFATSTMNDRITAFFVSPGEPVEIKMTDQTFLVSGLLTNASETYPEGEGFKAEAGEQYNLGNIPYQMAQDIYILNEERTNTFAKYGLISDDVINEHNVTLTFLNKAKEALDAKLYDVAYVNSIAATQSAVHCYRNVRKMLDDSISTITIFFALLIPFAIICQQLFFSHQGMKRLAGIIMVFSVLLVLLYIVHPAFHIASNTPLVLLGTALIVLIIPAFAVFQKNLENVFDFVRKKLVGFHHIYTSDVATSITALSIGIEYMKKNRLRTVLTLTTLTILSFSLTIFTFTSVTFEGSPFTTEATPIYEGIFVRNTAGKNLLEFMPSQYVDYFSSLFKDSPVAPRMWNWPGSQTEVQTVSIFVQNREHKIRSNAAFLCLSSNESEVSGINSAILEGKWFSSEDVFCCIISDVLTQEIGAGVGENITIQGISLTVAGIFNSTMVDSIKDLDGYPITPLDRSTENFPIYLPSQHVIIMPYELGKMLGFSIWSVSIKLSNAEEISKAAQTLVENTYLEVYSGYRNAISVNRRTVAFSTQGWDMMAVPFLISALIVANAMLGYVYEKVKEISIYSALGLSPRQIVIMFLTQFLTFGLIGSIIGYTAGCVFSFSLYRFNILPQGFYPNSSSIYVIYAVGFIILTCILSGIYPLRIAAKGVTPSLERKWKVPTKPKGDEWTIPLPLISKDKSEILGILSFLREYFKSSSSDRSTFIMASDYVIEEIDESRTIRLTMKASIAPFDAGIRQNVEMSWYRSEEVEEYTFQIILKRITGSLKTWSGSNYKFIDLVRKQLLLWKSLRPTEKARYIDVTEKND